MVVSEAEGMGEGTMRLLILGGTKFLRQHLVAAALARRGLVPLQARHQVALVGSIGGWEADLDTRAVRCDNVRVGPIGTSIGASGAERGMGYDRDRSAGIAGIGRRTAGWWARWMRPRMWWMMNEVVSRKS